ncbi:hypothetical protein [Citrobacter koseri]|uniref:hypothetical protein n=1 Tax=Citrobacter koseri TaxID=545 RepID=UPI001F436502|nr:hypothetical protein [Citrobacter koseri]
MKPTYEELEAQVKQLEADNEKAMSVLKEANDAVLLAKSKFDALAAENAGDASVKITRFRVYNGDENVEQYDEGAYVIYEDAMEIINELSRRLGSVSAENILLKSAHPQPFGPVMMKALDAYEKHQDETPETGMLDAFFILRDSIRVETPATDAFLAEVRAQGVEGIYQFNTDKMGIYLDGDVCALIDHYAAQLRKGVQS